MILTEHLTSFVAVQCHEEAAIIFPTRSAPLKIASMRMGIQDPRRQLIISDAMPGYKHRVAKYTKHMEIMYGWIILAISHLARIPPGKTNDRYTSFLAYISV